MFLFPCEAQMSGFFSNALLHTVKLQVVISKNDPTISPISQGFLKRIFIRVYLNQPDNMLGSKMSNALENNGFTASGLHLK